MEAIDRHRSMWTFSTCFFTRAMEVMVSTCSKIPQMLHGAWVFEYLELISPLYEALLLSRSDREFGPKQQSSLSLSSCRSHLLRATLLLLERSSLTPLAPSEVKWPSFCGFSYFVALALLRDSHVLFCIGPY